MAKKTSQTKAPSNAGKADKMAKSAASAKPMAKDTKAVGFVMATAINKDVGRKVVETICAAAAQLETLELEVARQRNTKGEALSSMAKLFYDAAKIDKRIDLSLASKGNKSEKNILFDRLRVVLGILEVNTGADGAETRTQSEWAGKMFPKIGEKKTDGGENFTGRETNRANFATQMRQAANAAYGAVSKGITAEIDKATGLLAISGKAVKEHFNQDRVILNEKQNFQVGSTEVSLKAKPSISELARMGGAITPARTPAAGGVNPANNEQVKDRLDKFREGIIDKLATFNDDVATALDALRDAIDNAIARNEAAAKTAPAKKTA